MPIPATAETILWAIQTARRLAQGLQRAYVHSLRERKILLPLPTFDHSPTLLSADRFFSGSGSEYLDALPYLTTLHQKQKNGQLTPDEREEYLDMYVTCFSLQRYGENTANILETSINPEEVINLLRIRQWEMGRSPQPTALQVAAGTLVETGIDFLVGHPGLATPQTAEGRALRALLEGLERVTLTLHPFQATVSRELVPALFTSAAEALAELGPALSDDPSLHAFIEETGRRIAQDLLHYSERINEPSRDALRWGPILLRSLIKQAGEVGLEQSSALFGTDAEETILLQETGSLVLSILLQSEDGIDLSDLFTVPTADALVRTIFSVLARYPELLSEQEAVQGIARDVIKALSQSGIQRPGFLPFILNEVLRATARHIPAFWKEENRERQQLLIQLIRETLQIIAQTEPDGRWTLRWTDEDVLHLINQWTDVVIAQPDLLEATIGNRPVWIVLVRTTLNHLQTTPRAERWQGHQLIILFHELAQALLAVPTLFQKSEAWVQSFLQLLVNRLIGEGYVPEERLENLLKYIFKDLATRYPDEQLLVFVHILLSDFFPMRGRGHILDLTDILEWLERIVRSFPAWKSPDNPLLRFIDKIEDLLGPILHRRPESGPNMLGIYLDIILEYREQLSPDLEEEVLTPLVQTTSQIIEAWQPDQPNQWMQRLEPVELEDLFAIILDRTLIDPLLLKDGKVTALLQVLTAAIDDPDTRRHLPFHVMDDLLDLLFELMLATNGWTKNIRVRNQEEVWALHYALEWLMAIFFRQERPVRTFLSRPDVFRQTIHAYSRRCELENLTEKGIDRASLHLNELLLGVSEQALTEADYIQAIWSTDDFPNT